LAAVSAITSAGRLSRQSWRGAQDGLIGPLALSFDTEMSADLFEQLGDILPINTILPR
jgi:hypothetical protein